jgi:hypothetical protein
VPHTPPTPQATYETSPPWGERRRGKKCFSQKWHRKLLRVAWKKCIGGESVWSVEEKKCPLEEEKRVYIFSERD